jgi:hypothetical protein
MSERINFMQRIGIVRIVIAEVIGEFSVVIQKSQYNSELRYSVAISWYLRRLEPGYFSIKTYPFAWTKGNLLAYGRHSLGKHSFAFLHAGRFHC